MLGNGGGGRRSGGGGVEHVDHALGPDDSKIVDALSCGVEGLGADTLSVILTPFQ